jgi:hypothetical protein
MNKLNRIEHGAAAGAALLITLAVVWAFATIGYPAPAEASAGIAAGTSSMHCRPG